MSTKGYINAALSDDIQKAATAFKKHGISEDDVVVENHKTDGFTRLEELLVSNHVRTIVVLNRKHVHSSAEAVSLVERTLSATGRELVILTGATEANAGKKWTPADVQTMIDALLAGEPVDAVAENLGRKATAITSRMRNLLNAYRAGTIEHTASAEAVYEVWMEKAAGDAGFASWLVESAASGGGVPVKAGAPWEIEEMQRLSQLISQGYSVSEIAQELGRNENAVNDRLRYFIPADAHRMGVPKIVQVRDLLAREDYHPVNALREHGVKI